jgi:hypothetical protein
MFSCNRNNVFSGRLLEILGLEICQQTDQETVVFKLKLINHIILILIKKLKKENDEETRCNAELENYLKSAIEVIFFLKSKINPRIFFN